jgi:hypothetical protein
MLVAEGQGRWLDRGRLTDGMLVLLLLDKVETLRYLAAERPRDAADDRARMIAILMRWVATTRPGSERDEVAELVEALRRHDAKEAERLRRPARVEKEQRRQAERADRRQLALQLKFGRLIARAQNLVTNERTSSRTLVVDRATGRRIILGERAALQDEAARLEAELGARFLSPEASPSYRAARARKWKQHVLSTTPR